jgi:hypothetical protein
MSAKRSNYIATLLFISGWAIAPLYADAQCDLFGTGSCTQFSCVTPSNGYGECKVAGGTCNCQAATLPLPPRIGPSLTEWGMAVQYGAFATVGAVLVARLKK